jgi:hypothetical protein
VTFVSSAELPSVAKIKIPKERYSSWDAPETEAESEELETDIFLRLTHCLYRLYLSTVFTPSFIPFK